ncbi:MAG: hypothetical protein M3Y59_22685 [Myxococcota bacterium]|nr:hypothetical protein [Myxococcota bacterium]
MDTFVAPSTQVATGATRPADGLKAYQELSAGQRSLLGSTGEARWPQLTTKERGVFLMLSGRLEANGFNLEGLSLKGGADGINGTKTRFELIFDLPSAEKLKSQLDAKVADGSFFSETPKAYFHKEFAQSGARENREKYTMQLGFGSGGAFVDMDRYNPRTSTSNWVKHWGEILTPGNMDPAKVAKEIGTPIFSQL